MKTIKIIVGILSVFVTLPIQFYLLYQLLDRTHASELMWFLYWVQLPMAILIGVVNKLIESAKT